MIYLLQIFTKENFQIHVLERQKTSEKSAIKFENQFKPNDEIQDHYKWAIDSELQFNHGIFAEN